MSKNTMTIERIHIGDEPIILDTITDPADSRLVHALNWYNYMYTIEKGKGWLLQLLKKNYPTSTHDAVRNAPNWRTPTTICWMAKMMLNGTKFEGQLMDYFNRKIQENVSVAPKSVVKSDKPKVVVDIQARVRENADKRIGEIDSEIDIVMKGGKTDIYAYLTKNEVSPQVASIIKVHFDKHLQFLKGDDPQIEEAYGKKVEDVD